MQTEAIKSIPIKFEKYQAVVDADCQRRIIAVVCAVRLEKK